MIFNNYINNDIIYYNQKKFKLFIELFYNGSSLFLVFFNKFF